MSDCRFGVSPVNYPDPGLTSSKLKPSPITSSHLARLYNLMTPCFTSLDHLTPSPSFIRLTYYPLHLTWSQLTLSYLHCLNYFFPPYEISLYLIPHHLTCSHPLKGLFFLRPQKWSWVLVSYVDKILEEVITGCTDGERFRSRIFQKFLRIFAF